MIAFLNHGALPEAERITVWIDNCRQLPKQEVTNGDVQFDEMEFRYFAAGHSMMAADSYHRRIECKFKKMQVKPNFRDFICLQVCR